MHPKFQKLIINLKNLILQRNLSETTLNLYKKSIKDFNKKERLEVEVGNFLEKLEKYIDNGQDAPDGFEPLLKYIKTRGFNCLYTAYHLRQMEQFNMTYGGGDSPELKVQTTLLHGLEKVYIKSLKLPFQVSNIEKLCVGLLGTQDKELIDKIADKVLLQKIKSCWAVWDAEEMKKDIKPNQLNKNKIL